jgi:hypothetical protein
MLERISFQLANNRGRYTHFIHLGGTVASLYPLEALHEARVGIICDKEFPDEAQYHAMHELAGLAVGVSPLVIMTFDEGTAPFPAVFSKGPPSQRLPAGIQELIPPPSGAAFYKQAIAIGLSKARKKGAKVPKKKS